MATRESLYQVACAAIDNEAAALQKLSHAIWQTPELNYEEHEAHRNLTAFLEARGLPVRRAYLTDTAFRADYGHGDTTVALLCEYDALPGIGHACGHNLIAEVGVAASLGVKAALDAGGLEMGKLSVLGTPAEEGGGGKALLLDKGAFKDVDCALMAHPFNANVTGGAYLAIERLTVTYRGKASHASGFPWEGINALDAAVMAYNAISCLRQQMMPAWRVHGIISKGGVKPNIIPEESQMRVYIRAPDSKQLETLKSKVLKCLESAATATGCQMELEWDQYPYLDVISNVPLLETLEKHMTSLGMTAYSRERGTTSAGSTDMGNVSYAVPSAHPCFYIGSEAVNHTRAFTAAAGDEKAQPYTLTQAKVLAMTAIDAMCDPDLRSRMRESFNADLLQRM